MKVLPLLVTILCILAVLLLLQQNQSKHRAQQFRDGATVNEIHRLELEGMNNGNQLKHTIKSRSTEASLNVSSPAPQFADYTRAPLVPTAPSLQHDIQPIKRNPYDLPCPWPKDLRQYIMNAKPSAFKKRSIIPVTQTDMRAMSHHLYIDKKHKVVMCMVPKVACTEFIRLFVRMAGLPNWSAEPHYRKDRFSMFMSQLSTAEATQIMNDPSYIKAVFFRDPAERLLSAYLDKFYNKGAGTYSIRLWKASHKWSLEELVDHLDMRSHYEHGEKYDKHDGLHYATNPHWKPQRYVCNLDKWLPLYDFVGNFSHLGEHAQQYLKHQGLWEEYGSNGWGKKKPPSSSSSSSSSSSANHGPMFAKNQANHFTGSKSKMEIYFTSAGGSDGGSGTGSGSDSGGGEEKKIRERRWRRRGRHQRRRLQHQSHQSRERHPSLKGGGGPGSGSRSSPGQLLHRLHDAYRMDYQLLDELKEQHKQRLAEARYLRRQELDGISPHGGIYTDLLASLTDQEIDHLANRCPWAGYDFVTDRMPKERIGFGTSLPPRGGTGSSLDFKTNADKYEHKYGQYKGGSSGSSGSGSSGNGRGKKKKGGGSSSSSSSGPGGGGTKKKGSGGSSSKVM